MTHSDHAQIYRLAELGWVVPRRLPTGQWAALHNMIFTTALIVSISDDGMAYEGRYCYEDSADALLALLQWDGAGDPPGHWVKRKGFGEEDRLGPGALGEGAAA